MIKSITWLALIMAALLCAQDRMRPGLWENTVNSHGRTSTQSHCMTAAELATTNGPIEAIRESMVKAFAAIPNGNCTLKGLKITGNSMTSQTVCGTTSFAHVTVFHGDTAETTSTSNKDGVITVTHITGRRLGVCP